MCAPNVEQVRPSLHGFSTFRAHTSGLMRSRLAHTLSFWLLGAVAVSVFAMGSLTAWNLRQGFDAYLQARDLERFGRFVALVETRLASRQFSLTDPESANRLDMHGLLRELAMLEGVPVPDRQPPGLPDRPGPPGSPRGGPPPGGGDAFGARVALSRPDGQPWAGPAIDPDAPGVIERPVRVDGSVVALARLRPMPPAPRADETRFLRSQYLGIAAVASVLLLLALGCALWLARQWARPLAAVQAATARIAQGELDVRLHEARSDEIGDVVRNVNKMATSLQRMEGARRQWLADLSHELRTPLTVLRGDIEALVDGVRPLNAAAVLLLREDVLRLGTLVEDLHLLSMADLQALPCHFADADAVQIVQGTLARHAQLATDAGLRLSIDALPAQAAAVFWDTGRIEQLLTNLLHNSLRYTDAPGSIVVGLDLSAQQVHLHVQDSAPGVSAGDLQRVFEPLYRADAARSRHNGGSGLGLAICAAIVQAHGGTIRASVSPLGGLRVDVTLPLRAKAKHP